MPHRIALWRGHQLVKDPQDLAIYWRVIHEQRPDVIVETGTGAGGSALFFADMLSLFHPTGRVITVDINAAATPPHPGVTYLSGSSTDPSILSRITEAVRGKTVMVSLDSLHRHRHVAREIELYAPLVTRGQYLVVEDCYARGKPFWPMVSVTAFLEHTTEFQRVEWEGHVLVVTKDGWLRRR